MGGARHSVRAAIVVGTSGGQTARPAEVCSGCHGCPPLVASLNPGRPLRICCEKSAALFAALA
jgi:hypothetical protein